MHSEAASEAIMTPNPLLSRGVAAALCLTLLDFGVAAAESVSQAIRVGEDAFVPGRGEAPEIPQSMRATVPAPGEASPFIVQFRGPLGREDRLSLEALGGEVLGYLPDHAYKVRMTEAQSTKIAALPRVSWIGRFHPAYKLPRELWSDAPTGLYLATLEEDADADAVARAGEIAGASSISIDRHALVFQGAAGAVEALAGRADVLEIEPFRFPERHNAYGAGVILGANEAAALGYDGSTQIIAIADTGLGDGTSTGAHGDIEAERIVAIIDRPPLAASFCNNVIRDGAADPANGHGTHVTVTAVGNGSERGVAPAARLVFQAVEDYNDFSGVCAFLPDDYILSGIPIDLQRLFRQAYRRGARIHSNSWGLPFRGIYSFQGRQTDRFVDRFPHMTITFSAGNSGSDLGSVTAPATAKNVITVGASENDRQGDYACDLALDYSPCAFFDGQNRVGENAGNAEQVAHFSGRGPTKDGRIKPDVVAPGTWVLSGYAGLHREGYDPEPNPVTGLFQEDGWGTPQGPEYKYFGGTSMANPMVAGAATVIRDHYQKSYSHRARAALVKATLINSAVDLLDENADGIDDNAFPIPNIHEGWGRVDVAAAVDGSHFFDDRRRWQGLETGEQTEYAIESDGSEPLKITLVWTDKESLGMAAKNLVNDLDLVIESPSGERYFGNHFSNGWSIAGRMPDRLNNVESVYLATPSAGRWRARVVAFEVPFGPQAFSIVVDGATSASRTNIGWLERSVPLPGGQSRSPEQ
jgi:subtilisin family serine protease